MSHKKYPSTYVTSDIVVLHHSASGDQILLIQRKNEPFKDHWALPGGFLDPDDIDIKVCASRELEEETSLIFQSHEFKMIGVYSKKNRDPRENDMNNPCRIISIAFLLRTQGELPRATANDDAKQLAFFHVTNLPPLAFDHAQIISDALQF